MSADRVIVFYGLRHTLNEDELDAVESNADGRLVAARKAKLQTHFGRLTDGAPHFLLIGARLGILGVENELEHSMDSAELEAISRGVDEKLRIAGMTGKPKLFFQLEAQY